VPLADTPELDAARRDPSPDAIRRLHDAQPWRLVHWRTEQDALTHRRFFNVTGLVGVRVEDPRVFDDSHALILDLVTAGIVQGLRIDHVDGLADPAAYLARLRARLPDTPIWVEKILSDGEDLPPGRSKAPRATRSRA
jgi:(1->4)-alpha-D-glucan 1-alpha-D-glucosylmutase